MSGKQAPLQHFASSNSHPLECCAVISAPAPAQDWPAADAGVQTIPYSQLMGALEVENVRQLEDLLITDCFYSGLLKGKLDQERK